MPRVFVVQTDQRLAERRFAGAAFADQSHHFALGDRERDLVERVHDLATADREVLRQFVGADQHVHEARA